MFDLLQSNNSHLPFLDILFRLCLAAFLGGMIGIDREVRNRTAGLRTHMLTSLAAATFTIGAWEIFFEVRMLEQPVSADPIRIIEAVTAGVAFLAAGTIIHSSGKVKGLTTGASMWLAGAVGMVRCRSLLACGSNHWDLFCHTDCSKIR